MIIIDEYENVQGFQRNINTLLKKVDDTCNITYRIGMRTEGMTYETNIGKEDLQLDRDYLHRPLIIKNNNDYKGFLRVVSEKRLRQISFFSEHRLCDIEVLLGKKENLEAEAKEIVDKSPVGREKHFELLKNCLPPKEYALTISTLSYPQNPLIEMLNILWILRGNSIKDTHRQMTNYINGNYDEKNKYKRDYVDKYKYHLLFILINIHRQKNRIQKRYYSFNTFAFLSSGSVNDFISLCRNTFLLLDDDCYTNILKGVHISFDLQTEGALETAEQQLKKIKANNDNGTHMHTFIMNLGNLFSYFHKDPMAKYPETNQFAFQDEAGIESNSYLESNLKSLVKWGTIIKKHRVQSISAGERKGSLYYLNHIFAPTFNISYRLRGGINPIISQELFSDMLTKSMAGNKIASELYVPQKQIDTKQLKIGGV